MSSRILQPGEIEQPASAIPELRLPAVDVFDSRAARFRALAAGNTIGACLGFLAQVADAQQSILQAGSLPRVADAAQREQASRAGMPPLPAQGAARPPGWTRVFRSLLEDLSRQALPQKLSAQLAALMHSEDAWLDQQAANILAARHEQLDLAAAPLIAAALQVIWTAQAATLTPAEVGPILQRSLCPVCGSHPVASVVRIGAEVSGYRYLHCSLCNTEWHLVRVKCSNCESTKNIDYREIEGGAGAIKAECCGECRSYLKQFYQEKAPELDPVADDLASLTLDLLLDEQGFARSGTNLMLFQGTE
ncbi:MAG: formate dehydrogenase accessory protein FdhE [Betaproteobacteria bacterium]|nr:formate dehydrogenase accessory protein FdhE [Betaproteobacteria bacterium]